MFGIVRVGNNKKCIWLTCYEAGINFLTEEVASFKSEYEAKELCARLQQHQPNELLVIPLPVNVTAI